MIASDEMIYEATVRVTATTLAGLQEFYDYIFDMPMRLEDPERRIESLQFELPPELANQLAMSLFARTRGQAISAGPPAKSPEQLVGIDQDTEEKRGGV